MIAPDQQTINTLAWVVLMVMGVLQQLRTSLGHKITHKQQEELKADNAEIKADTQLIKKSVNGPLGIALASAARALEELARAFPTDVNILQAVSARNASREHDELYKKSLEEQLQTEAEKREIISTFIEHMKEKGS